MTATDQTIHPTLPYVLTSSDDGHIKIFDFSKEFRLVKDYDKHTDEETIV